MISCFLLTKGFKTSTYFVLGGNVCVTACLWGVRWQCEGVSSLLPCGSQGQKSGYQVWWQALPSPVPSCCPMTLFFLIWITMYCAHTFYILPGGCQCSGSMWTIPSFSLHVQSVTKSWHLTPRILWKLGWICGYSSMRVQKPSRHCGNAGPFPLCSVPWPRTVNIILLFFALLSLWMVCTSNEQPKQQRYDTVQWETG